MTGQDGSYDVCPWHSAHGIRTVQKVPTAVLIASCSPGNRPPPWSWEDEAREVDFATCCCGNCPCGGSGAPGWYQRQVEMEMAASGSWIGAPAMLGSDGIVRDGHHRVIAAWRLGLPHVEAVSAEWPLWWQQTAASGQERP